MVQRLRINGIWTQFVEPLRKLAPFETGGNMRGITGKASTTGRLPEPYRTEYVRNPRIDYTVMSYNTPIAWHTDREENAWAFPSVRYSNTTTKQQGRIFTALSQITGGQS